MTKKTNYDVIIIGAGIGGLTTGNILAKNGLKVLILEKNTVPGGAVTTYYRNGYPIDISHSLCALKEGAFIRKMFEYLNIYHKLEFMELDKSFIYITKNQNKPIFCYSSFNKYTLELSKYFPEDTHNIENFFKEVVDIWKNEILKSYYNPSILRLLSYPLIFPRLFKYRNFTFDQLLNRFFNNNELKSIVSVGWPYLGLEKEHSSALYMICLLGAYHNDKSYFVKGGFGKISEVLASNFKEIGGEIAYNIEAKKILMDTKKVTFGIKDNKNNIYTAKNIISNVDSKKTFLDLVDENCLPINFLNKIRNLKMSYSTIQVHLVADAEINEEFLFTGSILLPQTVDLEKKIKVILKSNLKSHSKPILMLSIKRLEDFTSTKEKGSYVFNICWFPANYFLWKEFVSTCNREEYEMIKNDIMQLILAEIRKICSVKDLKFSNVLTPISLEKWLNATEGAIYDSAAIPNQMLLNRLMNKTILKNFYLVGTKTFPGAGIAGALISAFSLSDSLLNNKITQGKITL